MGAINTLTGDDVFGMAGDRTPYGDYASSPPSPSAVGDAVYAPIADSGDNTSAKVALLLVVGVGFIVLLRAGGFRDMVATP